MEYILSNVFGQTASRYGPVMALGAVLLFGAIALAAYYLKTKIDLMRQDALAREGERVRELESRERERQAQLAEMAAARNQLQQFMGNHLEHDRQERENHARLLNEITLAQKEHVIALRTISEDINAHRQEERDRASKVFDRLENLRVQIAEARGPHA